MIKIISTEAPYLPLRTKLDRARYPGEARALDRAATNEACFELAGLTLQEAAEQLSKWQTAETSFADV